MYLVVLFVTVGANLFVATADLVPAQFVVNNATKLSLPTSMLPLLGVLKGAGAIGLLVGLAIPLIGVAASIGLILFFTLAVGAHLRARDYRLLFPGGFLLLAVATLSLGLAT